MITVLASSDFMWQDEQVETGVSAGAITLDRGSRRDGLLPTAPTCIGYAVDEHAPHVPHSRSHVKYILPRSGSVSSFWSERDSWPVLLPTVTSLNITHQSPTFPVHEQVDADVPPEYWSRVRALLAHAPIIADDVDIDDEPVL